MKAILVGYGEVGQGIFEVLKVAHNIDIVDPQKGYTLTDISCDLLLIAIPYNDEFNETVKLYQKRFPNKATIIFSSVPVGTCRRLNAIHSPIEGHHSNMAASIREFPRWVGGVTDKDGFVGKFFQETGLIVKSIPIPEITEFMKLQSTTIYGINIEWAGFCSEVADIIGFDYDLLKQYNDDYNHLVQTVHKDKNLVRYNLMPPVQRPIGGHCILPNAKLLKKEFSHPFIATLLNMNE
jgi:hypothetical protein